MITRRDALIGGAATAFAASLGTASAADMAGDIDILQRAYTALHPGLLRYASQGDVDARFARLKQDWGRAPTQKDAYLSLSRCLATVRCGHTYANFYNQKRAVSAALFAGKDRLPFHFRWLGDRMVITKNQSGHARLAPGTEVLSVDGRPVARILRALMPYARADGHNDAKRRALLEVQGDDSYETFDIFHGLVFGAGDAFRLRVRPPGATRTIAVEVAPIDLAQRRTAMAPEGEDNAPLWTFAVNDGVGVLIMPSWAVYNSKWDWRAYLDDVFVKLGDARALIVDLRGNEGGNDCGNDIIARLIDADLKLAVAERRVRYRTTPADLNPYLDTWDDSFRNWGDDAVDLGAGFYRLKDDNADGEEVDLIAPKGPRFRGKVIVLIDAQNSSATFQFADAVRANGLATLVGSPTGGNQRGINGGAFFFLRLPASGLEADLPLIGRFPPTPRPDAGLTPDVAVVQTIADIAAGRDAVMERALGLARA